LNTTWFNNLPLFDEDKSLVLVFDLIESEAVLAKVAFILSNASYSSIKSIKHDKQSVVYTKQSVVSISNIRALNKRF